MTARAGGAALRRQIRALRRSLTAAERAEKDAAILATVRSLHVFRRARRVAFFFAFDGEPDLEPVIDFDRGKDYFVPVLRAGRMQFAAVGPTTRLAENGFGILEPARPELVDPRSLDLVLTPLVAFDANGNRLGVGAGYYDRCFGFLLHRQRWHRPKLLATAYALQEIAPFEPNSWDVPLWAAVTENGVRYFR